MILSDTAIKRPVFTTMAMLALVVFGLVSIRDIGIDLFPRVEFPVITVITILPGADPETVEQTVTDPIEEAVSTISGIKSLRSTSTDGVSQVVIEFELEKSVDVAFQEVQAKLGTIRGELPKDIEAPVVEKFDIDSSPILSVIVSGDMPSRDLTRLADKTVKERLNKVKNVGQVKLVGGRDRKIWIWLDRGKLEGHGLTVQDVDQALRLEHIEYPGGRVETGSREFAVKTKAEFASVAEIENMVVAYREGAPILVHELGRVEDGLEEDRSLARLNDRRAIALLVRRQSGTNTVQVARAVKDEVERLRKELEPQGVRLEVAQDLSVYIEHSIHEIQFHLFFGGLLAVLIVWLFLRNLRITVISALAIPTSVIATFILMNALGFTMNMMTMLALSLSIGILIDDAIVVVENIFRHCEEGKAPHEAASFGTSEIGLAALAITLSIVAVFVPVAFMKGIVGRFFFQFGLTVTFAVLISLFVAFTLTPMLASRFLRVSHQHGVVFRVIEGVLKSVDRAYARLLATALRFRWVTVLVAVAVLLGTLFVSRFMRTEFIPTEDQSEFNIKVRAPLGASLATTDEIFSRIRERIQGQEWLEYTAVSIGADELQRVNEGTMYVKMKDKDQRSVGQVEAMAWARRTLESIQNAKVSVEVVPRVSGGGRRSAEVQLEIRGTDLDKLNETTGRLIERMRKAGGYADIDTTFEKGKPEINVYVKRDRSADIGVSPLNVASTIKALIGGNNISKFRAGGDRYDIAVRLEEDYRSRPDDIDLLTVRNNQGRLVNMRNVAWVDRVLGPVQIDRYNRARQITLLANLQADKKVLGEAVSEISGFMKEEQLPPGYSYGFAGTADTMGESFGYLLFALLMSVLIVYMVLGSQFESFAHPMTIMISLPLAVVGALGALVATGLTMSIFTMIGIIMLMGLVTKNAILLVDYTNTLRERYGMECTAALLKAGPVRLRPILMTTLAMIGGMFPIAVGTGAGSESRAPMAVAVIGGLITSTLLTLVVVPVVYTIVDDLVRAGRWRIAKWWRVRPAQDQEEKA